MSLHECDCSTSKVWCPKLVFDRQTQIRNNHHTFSHLVGLNFFPFLKKKKQCCRSSVSPSSLPPFLFLFRPATQLDFHFQPYIIFFLVGSWDQTHVCVLGLFRHTYTFGSSFCIQCMFLNPAWNLPLSPAVIVEAESQWRPNICLIRPLIGWTGSLEYMLQINFRSFQNAAFFILVLQIFVWFLLIPLLLIIQGNNRRVHCLLIIYIYSLYDATSSVI